MNVAIGDDHINVEIRLRIDDMLLMVCHIWILLYDLFVTQ